MRKNRVLIFLLIIAVVLGFVFYKISNGKEYLTFDKVKEEVISKCEDNQYDDASKYIEKELNDNPNIAANSDEREELKKMNERILKVKAIQPQSTDDEQNIKKIKLSYTKGGDDNFAEAKNVLEESLKEFPTNEELLKLKNILEEEMEIKIEIEKPLISNPRPPVGNPQPQQEIPVAKDESPKQIPVQIKKINVGLAMTSQNIFTWNEKLSEISDIKLTIKITSDNLNFTKDVTGFSSYKFSTGNARWDGIPCTVELIIIAADDFVFSGNRKIEVQCACKP